MPFAEQGAASAATLAIVVLGAARLSPESFVEFNIAYLGFTLASTLANAVVYQYLLRAYSEDPRGTIRASLVVSGFLLALVIGAATVASYTYSFDGALLAGMVALFASNTAYELRRRLLLARGRWFESLVRSAVVFVVLVPTLWLLPANATLWIWAVAAAWGIACVPLLASNAPLSPKTATLLPQALTNLSRFGLPLIGSAAVSWFATGGYLVLLGGMLDAEEFRLLRLSQSFFNLPLLLLAAYENQILTAADRPSRAAIAQASWMVALACASMVIPVLGVLYVLTGDVPLLVTVAVAAFYTGIGISRVYAALLKWHRRTHWILLGQGLSTGIFIALIALARLWSSISASLVAMTWLCAQLIGTIVMKGAASRQIAERVPRAPSESFP